MESLLDKDIVQNISEAILKNQLAFTKKSKKLVDVPSLFRIIKKKLDFTPAMSFLKGKEEHIEKEINYEDFKSFVKDVNPYFKIDKSDKKYNLYLKNYYLVSLLHKNLTHLIKNRESPSVFKIFDVNSKCYVDWQDVGEEIKSGEFVSHDAKTIDEYIEIYLHAFISLEIPVVVETHAFNDLGELIKVCEHHID